MNQNLTAYLGTIGRVEFSPIGSNDMLFLEALYRSTREQELNLTDWNDRQKAEFIHQQFVAQHRFYTENYSGAFFEKILIDHEHAGRLYLVEWDQEIRIIDIALLPEFRNKGWGHQILQQIISKAIDRNKPIGIHVEFNNPVRRLYQRLGFTLEEDKQVYHFMKWNPPA